MFKSIFDLKSEEKLPWPVQVLLYVLLLICILNFTTQGFVRSILNPLVDFGPFYAGAQLLLQGKDFYDGTLIREILVKQGWMPEDVGGNPYLPFYFILMIPFSFLPYSIAKLLFVSISLILITVSVSWLLKRLPLKLPVILVVLFLFIVSWLESTYIVLNNGNSNVFVLFGIIGVLYFFKQGKYVLAAMLFVLAGMIKIFPVMLIIPFILKRKFRFALLLIGISVLAMFSSILICGIDSHAFALRIIMNTSTSASLLTNPINQSVLKFLGVILDIKNSKLLLALHNIITVILFLFTLIAVIKNKTVDIGYQYSFFIIAMLLMLPLLEWQQPFLLVVPILYSIHILDITKSRFLLAIFTFSCFMLIVNYEFTDIRLARWGLSFAMFPRLYGIMLLWLFYFIFFCKYAKTYAIKEQNGILSLS